VTRLPPQLRVCLLVGVCLLVASVAGALAGPGATQPFAGSELDSSPAVPTTESPDESSDGSTIDSSGDSTTDSADGSANDSSEEYLLVVEDAETGERLLTEPVAEGTTVALNYTHSVEKTPVLDVYEVNGTELEMVRMEFHSYGAGLPARADVNVTENGTFVFDPEGSYDHVYVTPGTIAGHELLVGDRTCDLVALSDASSVKLFVANRSATTVENEDSYRQRNDA